jgi:two-component system, NtrC family, sensor histidine kinase HydH
MSASDAIGVAASVGLLALALLCGARASQSPLALPLALLCLVISGWTGAGIAYGRSHALGWTLLDHGLTPLTAPLVLRFVLTFVGRRRAHRATMTVAFVACGALGASAALFVVPGAPFYGTQAWAVLLLSISLPIVAFALVTLALHLRSVTNPLERARTWLLITSFAIGTLLAATEELQGLAPTIPEMGNVGIAVAMVPLVIVALRFRLFDRPVSVRATTWFLVLAAVGVMAASEVWRRFDANVAAIVVGSAIVSIALYASSRRWLAKVGVRDERVAQLATVGRFSAQLAHDVKNPLAALKGAAQLLREDMKNPSPTLDRGHFLDLILSQIERLDTLVDAYGRLARVDPNRVPLDPNDVVRDVLAMEAFAAKGISVRADLAPSLPKCRADREMLARILENLVRNAIEAMPSGGTVTVRTSRSTSGGRDDIAIAVEDTGHGMDPRTRDLALDDFFTTKAHGSGLGLAFVRRVAEAHGGEVAVASTEGRGTVLTVRLPVD